MIEKTENKELIIRKANSFVQEFRVSLSIVEARIVNYLIANINSTKYDTEFRKFKFSIKEFCDIVYPDKKQGDAYKRLPKIIKNLSDKSAWKEVESTERPGKMKKVLLRWVERPEFEEGFVTLELHPDLAPYLLQLDGAYFQYIFEYTSKMKSKYAAPLYDLLKSWEKIKTHTKIFEIIDLRIYMDAMEKSKDNVSEFKRRALDPAVNEINKITDLDVSYEEIKAGRKTTHIKFTINQKQNSLELKEKENKALPEQEDPMQESYELWAGACDNEFDKNQIKELSILALPHIEQCSNIHEHNLKVCDYIYKKYVSLANRKDIKHRFGYMKYLVENDC